MKIKNFIIAIAIPLAIGGLSAFLSKEGMTVYNLNAIKPSFSPPDILFPIVWTILYILMGVSSYIVYKSDNPNTRKALKSYVVQLIFNFGWSIIFFRFMLFLPAFLWLVILILLIINMIFNFYAVNKTSGLLQIPYLLWCLFAAYLNFSVYLLNR